MDLSRYTALVADDFATTRRIVSRVLRDAGFAHSKEAQDGVEALRQLAHLPKPFSAAMLIQKIKTILKTASGLQAK